MNEWDTCSLLCSFDFGSVFDQYPDYHSSGERLVQTYTFLAP